MVRVQTGHRRAPNHVNLIRSVNVSNKSMNGEFDFIERIRDRVRNGPGGSPDLVCGIGDDAAIIAQETGRESLITVDLLVEDVDFKLEYGAPRQLGHKALAVSLSDIAAMGGTPRFSLLTLGIPPQLRPRPQDDMTASFWEEFFAGYFSLARRFEVTLIGGDISSTPERMTIDSIVIGSCQSGMAIKRSGAMIGDAIYVTGELGASAAGLRTLLATPGRRLIDYEADARWPALCAHLEPVPRVDAGRRIGESRLAHSMIDISDGLAQDLGHICEQSNVGAIIDRESIPVSPLLSLVSDSADERFRLAASGGEDFELLFTAAPESEEPLRRLVGPDLPLTRIGTITERGETPVLLREREGVRPLDLCGYNHFEDRSPSPPATSED